MTSERWRGINELFQAAVKLEPQERPTFLKRACGSDEALRKEVESLLFHDERASTFIETPAFKIAEQSSEAFPSIHPQSLNDFGGTSRFLVKRCLGEGGFGVVYEAYDRERDALVALKVLRQTNPTALYNFKREFRALSNVVHRNL